MGVSISTQRDSVNCSVDKGGEHISQNEGDRNPIREKESTDNEGSLEAVNPFSESSSSFNEGFHQIKEKISSLQPSISQLDSKEENQNCDDKSGDLITDHNESEEPECATKVSETESVKDQNSKASMMKNVFSMFGISKKTLVQKDNENASTKLDEVLPEDQNLSHMNPISESLEDINDENTTGVSGDPLPDVYLKQIPLEQNEEQKNLMRITGEFPRLHCKTYSEEGRIKSAWFKKDLTNSLTIQQIYLAQPRSSPQKRLSSKDNRQRSQPRRRELSSRSQPASLGGSPFHPTLQKKRRPGSLYASPVRRGKI